MTLLLGAAIFMCIVIWALREPESYSPRGDAQREQDLKEVILVDGLEGEDWEKF